MNKLTDIYNLEDLRIYYINGCLPVLIDITDPNYNFMSVESCPTSDSGFDSHTNGGTDGGKFFFNENDIKPLELLKDIADPESCRLLVSEDKTAVSVDGVPYDLHGVTDNPDEIFGFIVVDGVAYFFDPDSLQSINVDPVPFC